MDDFEAIETRGDNHVGGWVTTTDSTRIWVDVHGYGRPILFLHGWTMSSAFWKRQLSLADHFQVVTMDLRGHGRSQSVLRGHTVPRYARDVRDVIRTLGLDRILLAGWSMGGAVVLEYWQQYVDDRVDGLALIECNPAPLLAAPWNLHRYCGGNLECVTNDLASMKSDRFEHAKRFINAMFLSGNAPKHALKWMLAEQLQCSDETASSIYQDYIQRDYTSIFPTITVPTLALYGRSKHMCHGPSTGRFVAGSISNSRFYILENSGHLPFYEEAALVNDTFSRFLNQL